MLEELKNYPEEFKTYFLLEFTRRLIILNSPTEFLKEKEKKSLTEREKFIERVKERLPEEVIKPVSVIPQTMSATPITRGVAPIPAPAKKPVIKIPEIRLPSQFIYLRPTSTEEAGIDLGKLNPLLQDSGVNIIETNGPNEKVIVRGRMGTKPTNIVLTAEEINKIIQIFSQKSKIPVGEGVTKIALGRYILSAIISKDVGSRFIIKKI